MSTPGARAFAHSLVARRARFLPVSASADGEGARDAATLRPPRPARDGGELVGSTRAHAASSSARPRARVSFLGDVAAANGPSWNLTAQLVLPALGALALAVFSACVAGFLVAVRELVRACREATIASRAVARCADSIDAACAALEKTLAKADTVLVDVDKIGSGAASVLETASREAGVLQRRLSDLPNTASRTLMEAITGQYANAALEDGDALVSGDAARPASFASGDARVAIGAVIEGNRDGGRWIGGKPGCAFAFDRANRFRVGEYCAVPRTDATYTWGVIELNDRDYSVDDSGDWDPPGAVPGSSPASSGEAGEVLSCVWPPRDPDEIPDTCVDGSRDFDAARPGRASEKPSGWLEKAVVSALGDERSERMETFVRAVTGLTPVEEGEYKVVVELDTDKYSFKIMNAGDLGKRVEV
jgi:tRNA (guanine10-N2)-methyltransferase